jgi:type VI secretion system protein ImpC
MPRESIPKRVEVHIGESEGMAAPLPETPFCIALLGDFTGRGFRGRAEAGPALARRPIVQVDRDNLDEVISRLAPEAGVSLGESPEELMSLRVSNLDDFHPDRLYERLPLFAALRQARAALADPKIIAEATTGQRPVTPSDTPRSGAAPAEPELLQSAGALLDRVLEQTAGAAEVAAGEGGFDLQVYLRRLVAPHIVPEADAQQRAHLAQLDAAIAAQVRGILHDPQFQAIEALWRGVSFLTRRIETDSQLRLYLIDMSHAELVADLATERPLETSGLYQLLVGQSVGVPGGRPWALLAGAYSFGPAPEDLRLLERLGGIALRAGAPWISAADARLVGCESWESTCCACRTEPTPTAATSWIWRSWRPSPSTLNTCGQTPYLPVRFTRPRPFRRWDGRSGWGPTSTSPVCHCTLSNGMGRL